VLWDLRETLTCGRRREASPIWRRASGVANPSKGIAIIAADRRMATGFRVGPPRRPSDRLSPPPLRASGVVRVAVDASRVVTATTARNKNQPRLCCIWHWLHRPVRLAYQPPANSTFLSEQTSHQQPARTSQQYSSLRTNQHQPSATSQPNVRSPGRYLSTPRHMYTKCTE
jgi:hypothetical protein